MFVCKFSLFRLTVLIGRSTLIQYMPKKPIKRGFKTWMLCDNSGYVHRFEIYTGKKGELVEKRLGERVVLDLTSDFGGKNHKVFFDNFFTSYNLILELKKKSINSCGTVRQNRKFLPTTIKPDKQLKRGEYDWQISDTGLLFMKWIDKRAVTALSNFHDPNKFAKVKQRQIDGSVKDIDKPDIIHDYNMHMNNVDKLDQLKKYYELDRKSRKWWHRIFFHFLDVAVVNAFIISKSSGYQLPLKDFKLDIISVLCQSGSNIPTTSAKTSKKKPKVRVNKHKPYVDPNTRASSSHQPVRTTIRRCAKCSIAGHQRRTQWMCSTCNVPLCLSKSKSCFSDFHK